AFADVVPCTPRRPTNRNVGCKPSWKKPTPSTRSMSSSRATSTATNAPSTSTKTRSTRKRAPSTSRRVPVAVAMLARALPTSRAGMSTPNLPSLALLASSPPVKRCKSTGSWSKTPRNLLTTLKCALVVTRA
ncbi:unnamed protein product, partial [Aphanomyces euteiches]